MFGVNGTIETERLLLRPFTADDGCDLVRLHAEESFWWYPLRRAMTPAESEGFLLRVLADTADPGRPAFHAVIERSSGALIGWAGLSVPDFLPEVLPAVEVGWRLGSDRPRPGIRHRGRHRRPAVGLRGSRARRGGVHLRAGQRRLGAGHGPAGFRRRFRHHPPRPGSPPYGPHPDRGRLAGRHRGPGGRPPPAIVPPPATGWSK